MFKIANRVKESSLSSGTGSLVLNGPLIGFQSFLSAIGDGNSTYYTIENESRWEVGIGTYTASSNSLSRDLVLSSSNAGLKEDLVGVSLVFCSIPSEKFPIVNPSGFIEGLTNYSGVRFPDGTIQYSAGLASGTNISLFNNDSKYTSSGSPISQFTNDAGYLTSAGAEQDTLDSVLSRGNSTNRSATLSGVLTATSGVFGKVVFLDGSSQTKAGAMSGDNISQFVNNAGYLTSFTESDTFDSVLSRGNSSSRNATLSGVLTVTSGVFNKIVFLDGSSQTKAGAMSGDSISQFVNNAGYLTSFTETDTLNSVLLRNNTTNLSVIASGGIRAPSGYFSTIVFGDNSRQTTAGVASGSNISVFVNNLNYARSGEPITQFTNNAGYLTSFTESDTLDSVLSRGSSTNRNATLSGVLTVTSGVFSKIVFLDGSSQTKAGAMSGDNISQFVNNVGYLTSFAETDTLNSVLSRNNTTNLSVIASGGIRSPSGYFSTLTFSDNSIQTTAGIGSGANISIFVNDVKYAKSGDKISQFANDAGYLTSSAPEIDTLDSVLSRGNSTARNILSSGAISGVSGIFNTITFSNPLVLVSKTSKSPTITYVSGVISSILYDDSSTKNLTWTSGRVSSVDHAFVDGRIYRKTLTYNASGMIQSVQAFYL